MPELTRRRNPDARQEESWQVYYGDVRAGTIARDQRDWTARKYAMWEAGERFPTQKPSSLMKCPCGETFDSHRLEHTVIHVPHITEAQRAHEIRH